MQLSYGMKSVEQTYQADKVIYSVERYEVSVKGDEKAALSDYLKLMDMQKAGTITDYGIKCITKDGKVKRYIKSWSAEVLL